MSEKLPPYMLKMGWNSCNGSYKTLCSSAQIKLKRNAPKQTHCALFDHTFDENIANLTHAELGSPASFRWLGVGGGNFVPRLPSERIGGARSARRPSKFLNERILMQSQDFPSKVIHRVKVMANVKADSSRPDQRQLQAQTQPKCPAKC